MAIIKLGALAQDVRGSLNGSTFSRNKGGAYVRSKVSPLQPVSANRDRSQAVFKRVQQAWGSELSDAQREAWRTWAATNPFTNVFGDAINLNGNAMFGAWNNRQMMIGGVINLDAPLGQVTPTPTSLSAIANVTGGTLSKLLLDLIFTGSFEDGQTVYIFGTKPISAGRVPQENDFRLINDDSADVIEPTDDIFTQYNARFPETTMSLGTIFYLRAAFIGMNVGNISVGVTAKIVVTAP